MTSRDANAIVESQSKDAHRGEDIGNAAVKGGAPSATSDVKPEYLSQLASLNLGWDWDDRVSSFSKKNSESHPALRTYFSSLPRSINEDKELAKDPELRVLYRQYKTAYLQSRNPHMDGALSLDPVVRSRELGWDDHVPHATAKLSHVRHVLHQFTKPDCPSTLAGPLAFQNAVSPITATATAAASTPLFPSASTLAGGRRSPASQMQPQLPRVQTHRNNWQQQQQQQGGERLGSDSLASTTSSLPPTASSATNNPSALLRLYLNECGGSPAPLPSSPATLPVPALQMPPEVREKVRKQALGLSARKGPPLHRQLEASSRMMLQDVTSAHGSHHSTRQIVPVLASESSPPPCASPLQQQQQQQLGVRRQRTMSTKSATGTRIPSSSPSGAPRGLNGEPVVAAETLKAAAMKLLRPWPYLRSGEGCGAGQRAERELQAAAAAAEEEEALASRPPTVLITRGPDGKELVWDWGSESKDEKKKMKKKNSRQGERNKKNKNRRHTGDAENDSDYDDDDDDDDDDDNDDGDDDGVDAATAAAIARMARPPARPFIESAGSSGAGLTTHERGRSGKDAADGGAGAGDKLAAGDVNSDTDGDDDEEADDDEDEDRPPAWIAKSAPRSLVMPRNVKQQPPTPWDAELFVVRGGQGPTPRRQQTGGGGAVTGGGKDNAKENETIASQGSAGKSSTGSVNGGGAEEPRWMTQVDALLTRRRSSVTALAVLLPNSNPNANALNEVVNGSSSSSISSSSSAASGSGSNSEDGGFGSGSGSFLGPAAATAVAPPSGNIALQSQAIAGLGPAADSLAPYSSGSAGAGMTSTSTSALGVSIAMHGSSTSSTSDSRLARRVAPTPPGARLYEQAAAVSTSARAETPRTKERLRKIDKSLREVALKRAQLAAFLRNRGFG